jgi:hypothetical protein
MVINQVSIIHLIYITPHMIPMLSDLIMDDDLFMSCHATQIRMSQRQQQWAMSDLQLDEDDVDYRREHINMPNIPPI